MSKFVNQKNIENMINAVAAKDYAKAKDEIRSAVKSYVVNQTAQLATEQIKAKKEE